MQNWAYNSFIALEVYLFHRVIHKIDLHENFASFPLLLFFQIKVNDCYLLPQKDIDMNYIYYIYILK